MDNVINAKNIPAGQTNILKLAEPENYRCVVHQLGSAGVRLDLEYLGDDEDTNSTIYVFLQDLLYFEGALEWVGAQMQVGTDDLFVRLLSEISQSQRQSAVNETKLKLYEIYSEGLTVRFIAGTTVVISSSPRMFET